MAPPKAAAARNTLDLVKKVEVIHMYEKGSKSQQAIATEFGVGKTQISNILKRRREYLDEYEANGPSTKKRNCRKTGNEEINKLCWAWFQDKVGRGAPANGPLLQEQALQFAEDLGITTFKASNGWLDSFKKRHNITGATIVGESGGVDAGVVGDWSSRLPNIIGDYAPENIYNTDETGIFFKQTTNKTLHVKGTKCSNGKQSRERVTCLVTVNMAGGKEKPLFIGKSENPHCLRYVNRDNLRCTYTHQRKAWMNSTIFTTWLKKFDARMVNQKRKVLLFLDNAPCHPPNVTLKNVKLVFFPANTTSVLQPCDLGVIRALKSKYRKRQLRKVLRQMDVDKDITPLAIAKGTNVLDAINNIGYAWEEIEPSTIIGCFKKAGFPVQSEVAQETPEETPEPELDRLSNEIYGCDLQDLPDLDQDLATCDNSPTDWSRPASELLSLEQADSSGDEEECVPQRRSKIKNFNQAIGVFEDLQLFFVEGGYQPLLPLTDALDEGITKMWLEKKSSAKQTKMNDFFKPVSK